MGLKGKVAIVTGAGQGIGRGIALELSKGQGDCNCCKTVIPFIIKGACGKIVNIGSVVGLTGGANTPASAVSCVSKAGVICLTKVLAGELAKHNMTVNSVAPGRNVTPLTENISPEIRDDEVKFTPLGRYGKPIYIARAARYLVSESGDYITGATLVIDGGRSLH